MAMGRFERTTFKRGGGKAGAAQRVQYISREGPYGPAEARVHHLDQAPGTERLRDDLVDKGTPNLPSWAKDASAYFTAAEKHERSNGAAYVEWKFSLPRELPREQQLAAARDLLDLHFSTKHVYVWAMHEPPAAGGGTNPHVHCLWSARTLDGIDRSPEQFFKRYNPTHPERGGAQKSKALTSFGEAKRERIAYTDIMNTYLEVNRIAARFHPGTLASRGFEREPEPRALPSDSNKAKYQRIVTETWGKVLDHRRAHAADHAIEQADAAASWEQRKQAIGIAPGMDHTQVLQRIGQAREHAIATPPPRQNVQELDGQAHALQAGLAGLERYAGKVKAEALIEAAYTSLGKRRSPAADVRTQALLIEGRQYGIDVEPARSPTRERLPAREPGRSLQQQINKILESIEDGEYTGGPGLRVRIAPDKEREQDRGRDIGF